MGQIELNKIYNMDCLDGIKQIEDNSIDLIVIDPPYGIGYKSNHGCKEYKERVQKTEWDKEFDFTKYYNEHMRILKPNSFMLVFGRIENYQIMFNLNFDRLLVWDKGHNGMGNLTDWGIGYEFIYAFKKGKPKLRGSRVNGVINIKHIGFFDKTLHPTQKPVKLIKFLIDKCSDKNDTIFDSFMGSGTTAVACKQLGRNFIGFELSEEYCKITNMRLKKMNNKWW